MAALMVSTAWMRLAGLVIPTPRPPEGERIKSPSVTVKVASAAPALAVLVTLRVTESLLAVVRSRPLVAVTPVISRSPPAT
ncbi:MAG: hypothetical protein ACE5GB_06550, partial [Acidimicrobiales bacterium]